MHERSIYMLECEWYFHLTYWNINFQEKYYTEK